VGLHAEIVGSNPTGKHGRLSVAIVVCCQVEVSATAVAQWLRCCATIRKVAGSISAGVIGIFH